MLSSLSKGYGSWTAGQVDPYYGEKYVSIKNFLLIIFFFFLYLYLGLYDAQIQEFLPGGSRPDCQKTVLTLLGFFFRFFFSYQLILQFYSGLLMIYFKEYYNFPRFQRGPTFSRGEGGSNIFQGGPTFSRGVLMLETHRTCDFPGVVSGPPIPLWIRTCIH